MTATKTAVDLGFNPSTMASTIPNLKSACSMALGGS